MQSQQLNKELMLPFFQAFRSKGYAGVSMNDLAEAVGLKKASLYHHFPKGKEQIAKITIVFMNEQTKVNIYNVLVSNEMAPEQRLIQTLENLTRFYKNGEENCLLGSIALDSNHLKFKEGLKVNTQLWLDAFYKLGLDFKFTADKAKRIAEQTLILIQGGLVVSRASDTLLPFKNTLKTIKNLYSYE